MSEQITLFDLHPEGAEPPVAQRKITLGCLLPIQSNQVIDIARASSILDLGDHAVKKLISLDLICGYRLTKDTNSPWRIAYSTVVDLCDSLRVKYCIADRRPKLPAGRRWQDSQILPFPKLDTISVAEAMIGLEALKKTVLDLIEEGAFDAYRFHSASPWRISKMSLFNYAARLKAELSAPRYQIRALRRDRDKV